MKVKILISTDENKKYEFDTETGELKEEQTEEEEEE